MITEYEVKFAHINIQDMRTKLEDIGAEIVMDRFPYKRYICDITDNSFMRLRTTPEGASLTIKEWNDKHQLEHLKEFEMYIKDFDEGKQFLDYFIQKDLFKENHPRYQENIRTMYKTKDCEFCIDEWPLIEPFLEIEASNEQILKDYATKLGLNWDDGLFGSVNAFATKVYGIDLKQYKTLTFNKQEI